MPRHSIACHPTARLPLLVSALAGALALLASPAHPWGATGHRVIGTIAQTRLSPAAAAAVADLLGPDSLARVGTWADEIRADPSWKRADTWHYVSIPDGGSYEASPKNEAGDLLEAIERFSRTLADRQAAREQRVEALKFLAHLIGDLHQPLHVGRLDDRGGNDILVLWFDEPTNLHSVWDNWMIDGSKLSYSELVGFIDHPTPEQVRSWQAGGPLDWAAESMALRPQLYELGDRRLGFRYAYRQWPTVEQRLLQAGVRLAGLLDRLLAPGVE